MPRLVRPSKAEYRLAVKVLRHGFVEPKPVRRIQLDKGMTRTGALQDARDMDFPVGGEYTYDPRTGWLSVFKRMGKLATGFDAKDGFNLTDIDNWKPHQKAKVTKLFNHVDNLTARPFYVYRARKPENLRAVQKAAQHEQFPKELKVAFVPSPLKTKPKIKITRKKQVTITERNIGKRIVGWEDIGITRQQVALNPKQATFLLTQKVKADTYVIQAGKYQIPVDYDAASLPRGVAKLVQKYGSKDFDPKDPNSSYFGNWLHGIIAYNFERGTDFKSFKLAEERSKRAHKEQRERDRRKFWRKYGHRRPRK